MPIHFQMNTPDINWTEVSNLFASVGWGDRDPHDLRAAFSKSSFACFAFDNDKLVGFGRTIDDGKYYATVVDVVVHPKYQHQNIGRQIMQSLQAALKGFLWTTLVAAPPVQTFYAKLGWRKLKTAMILPRSDEQARLNCE